MVPEAVVTTTWGHLDFSVLLSSLGGLGLTVEIRWIEIGGCGGTALTQGFQEEKGVLIFI